MKLKIQNLYVYPTPNDDLAIIGIMEFNKYNKKYSVDTCLRFEWEGALNLKMGIRHIIQDYYERKRSNPN